ncbi:hypothetical protein [Dongshaea marina]|uniref:hypothetical protein n=1 Tax=Dongshaea marina TaxID=2047966 RepID=UPI00131F1319|nr:hypothetical protein [Dongshaea marina]
MSDEQQSTGLFQAQPEGQWLFSLPAALSDAHVEQLHHTSTALLDEKISNCRTKSETSTEPRAFFGYIGSPS